VNPLQPKHQSSTRKESDFPFENVGSTAALPNGSTFLQHDFVNSFYPKPNFDRMLFLERKRTERSKRAFLLILLDIEDLLTTRGDSGLVKDLESALSSAIRETDIQGWYQQDKVIGIIFTELGAVDEIIKEKIFLKIQDKLCRVLGFGAVQKIKVSYHIFPEAGNENGKNWEWLNSLLYPELCQAKRSKRIPVLLKRGMDFVGSLVGLVILLPVFLSVALTIKLTSKGPVFFKQERVGQGGKKFTFLKFRSMYVNCDERAHKEYITKFISQSQEGAANSGSNGEAAVYKLTGDRRITPIGNFLRKTSLDELPQFINVLKGEMSLVGPRPPIPYECEIYDIWHRRRLIEVKPGITGLWQVEGRSKSAFNDMVRLDLKYINDWSLWLDLKILLKTPWVMITGNGGY
jgi:lipopolysaccharide/colanic/teichoic acid biosynthesis glycosyltransferase